MTAQAYIAGGRGHRLTALLAFGALTAAAILVIAPIVSSPAQAGGGCGYGKTTFKFNLPRGVVVTATKGAKQPGRRIIAMSHCSGGSGYRALKGGAKFKFDGNRGPTGDYRINYYYTHGSPGPGNDRGTVLARVVGKKTVFARIYGGYRSAQLNLTHEGAKRLNKAVADKGGPFEKGRFGTVTTVPVGI